MTDRINDNSKIQLELIRERIMQRHGGGAA